MPTIMTTIPETEFHQYQSQHLFLLIGSNPLPNYVTAKMLLKQDGHLYLVHTTGTQTIAERLKNELGRNNENTTCFCVDDSDGYNIATEIRKKAQGKVDVGLNYTGGTKAMAVYAYEAVRTLDNRAICSYLDPRQLGFVFVDTEQGTKFYSAYRPASSLKLENLLALHGLSLESPINTKPHWLGLVQGIQANYEVWRQWTNTFRKGDRLLPNGELAKLPLPDTALASLSIYWAGCATLKDLLQKWKPDVNPKGKVDDLAKWLEGEWLEIYTLHCIQNLQDKHKQIIIDCGSDVNPKERDFQFDVALMKGYQLYAISCTTDQTRSRCKQKLFELLIRARQMGGDEARTALICGASSADSAAIQHEVETEWDAEDRVRVFSIEAWGSLEAHLKDWLQLEEPPYV